MSAPCIDEPLLAAGRAGLRACFLPCLKSIHGLISSGSHTTHHRKPTAHSTANRTANRQPPPDEVILPIRMAKFLGCHSALITNAAGGINPSFKAGDLMLLEDHINFIGSNPLRGPNPAELGGPRFLDLSAPYDAAYAKILKEVGLEVGVEELKSGVYLGVSGPTYETRAEVRFFRVSVCGVLP